MIQSLDVISVNIWNILISLANLLILFWIVKRFLYKPVRKAVAQRQAELRAQYDAAQAAQDKAEENRVRWEEKLQTADSEAASILHDAAAKAQRRADRIVDDAKNRADGIVRTAEEEAVLERRKAADSMKREIVDISSALTEKLLEREISTEDHRELIESFIDTIGESNESNV